jgi:hypothetical protein
MSLGLLGQSRSEAGKVPQPVSTDTVSAFIAALTICVVMTTVSLLVPPFIDNDSGDGFLAWRGTLQGHFNSVLSPDHANIARDAVHFLTVWSPGQYLVPGGISLLGVPLGVAMTLTVGLALLLSLFGWVLVIRSFASRTSLALPVVILIGLFHYSTQAFSTYHGGEILLQAVTPWLILAAYQVPLAGSWSAVLLATGAVFLGFFCKTNGDHGRGGGACGQCLGMSRLEAADHPRHGGRSLRNCGGSRRPLSRLLIERTDCGVADKLVAATRRYCVFFARPLDRGHFMA